MSKRKKNKNREYFKGVLAKLIFVNKRDKNVVLNFMKRFSSAVRFAFNRLVEGVERSALWKVSGPIGKKFRLDSYYIQAVLLKAEALLESAKELGVDPRKVIFGGRKLFFELQKKHNPSSIDNVNASGGKNVKGSSIVVETLSPVVIRTFVLR